MADDEGKGGGGDLLGAVDKAVRLGADIIKWTCHSSSSAKLEEGGYAHCMPEGYTAKDLEGGEDKNITFLTAENSFPRGYKWHLTASWHANMTIRGFGHFIKDATMTVTMEEASWHTSWDWTIRFPGEGRWVDRKAGLLELPFTITIHAVDTIVVDTDISTHNWNGVLRGDGTHTLQQL
jgi:hypothetical protein